MGYSAGIAFGSADTANFRNFYKACENCAWTETTAGFHGYLYADTSGSTLPPNYTVPDTGFFTLGHFNNRLIAIDQRCYNGGWYSDDTGRTWRKYTGLPANTPLLCVSSPFDQVCLIGTYGAGLYVLNGNTGYWQQNNNGLTRNLVIRSITSKQNYYKNGTTKRFIYLATNQGIYQSQDDGVNWVCTIPGNFVAIY